MIVHATVVEQSTVAKTINTNSYYTMATLYHIRIILPFKQCEVQSGYSEDACMLIDQKLLAPVQR